jgi:hypothetical protein
MQKEKGGSTGAAALQLQKELRGALEGNLAHFGRHHE